MNARIHQERGAASRRLPAGFTLIEVLVVLGLTLVMMSMFATIFQITGTFVTKQKGIGENDQSARILTTVLKTDLEARTMRFLAPFHPNMAALGDDATNRQGYFYVSENDPTDDTDDVLQFTVMMNANNLTQLNNPSAGVPLFGRALSLPVAWQANTPYAAGALVRPASSVTATGFVYKNEGAAFTSGGAEPTWNTTPLNPPTNPAGGTTPDGGGTWTTLLSPLDQPDGDDAQMVYNSNQPVPQNLTLDPVGSNPNNTGASQFAEVSYFLRHGSLIRRVLLIRQPYDLGGQTSAQPYDTDNPPALMIPGVYPPYPAAAGSGNFWTDFDYSARVQPLTGVTPATGVQFLGVGTTEDSLDNLNVAAGGIYIGRPDNRFGFDQTYVTLATPGAVASNPNGAPREYAFQFNSATNLVAGTVPTQMFFFGRYTQEETSNANFQFPGNFATVAGLPVSPLGWASLLGLDSSTYTMWMLDANPPTAPVSLAGGSRRGEDILLTNVVSFDVKLWDAHYSEVPAGGGQGIDVNRNGVIDTGPAFADIGHAAPFGDFQQAKNAYPVYGPVIDAGFALPGTVNTWAPAFTRTFNAVTYNYNNVFDSWYRQFNFDNLLRVYDSATTAPNDSNVYAPAPYRPRLGNPWQPNVAYTVGQEVDPVNTANGYVYKCTVAGTSGPAPTPPLVDPFSLSDPYQANILTGLDGSVQWQAQAPVNVQAIQITVKYLDPTQNLLRQVTIVQSLTQ
jgi:hypothetical protein